MVDLNFKVKNGIVVNGAITINSTAIYANSAPLLEGNSTVNATVSATLIQIANSTGFTNVVPGQIQNGANVILDQTHLGIGNSTVNTTTNSTGFFINGSAVTTNASGSNTQIQFNDSGAFGGVASWTFDKSAIKVTLGNSTVNVAMNSSTIVVSSNASITLPTGNTSQRPTGASGMIRYNTETGSFEGYGAAWGTIGGGAGYFLGTNGPEGSTITGPGDIFHITSNTLSNTISIPSGNNSVIAGPFAVATGFTLTIQTGARVVIV